MNQDFNVPETPITPLEPPKKRNSTLIVIIVVVLLLLCCCCVALIWAGWTYGDTFLESIGIYLSNLSRLLSA